MLRNYTANWSFSKQHIICFSCTARRLCFSCRRFPLAHKSTTLIYKLSTEHVNTGGAAISFPLAYLWRFAHSFGQLIGGLGQQSRRHIAFGHVGVDNEHRHDYLLLSSIAPHFTGGRWCDSVHNGNTLPFLLERLCKCVRKISTAPPPILEGHFCVRNTPNKWRHNYFACLLYFKKMTHHHHWKHITYQALYKISEFTFIPGCNSCWV